MTVSVPLAVVVAVVGIAGGLVGILSPVFKLHSRLDLNDYRLTRMENSIQELLLEIKELEKRIAEKA